MNDTYGDCGCTGNPAYGSFSLPVAMTQNRILWFALLALAGLAIGAKVLAPVMMAPARRKR